MQQDLVSIIIPTYNREKLLKPAIISVLNQTYKNMEIIIVDDGSTDSTQKVVEELQLNDQRVVYYKLKHNSGAAAARNYGVDQASGKYIAFHDSDDVMRENRIEMQCTTLKQMCVDMVFGQVERIYTGADKCVIEPIGYVNKSSIDETYNSFLVKGVVWTQTILGEAKAIKSIKFDETMPNREDMDWSIRFAKKYKVLFVEEVVADSYISDDSISQNQSKALCATEIMYGKYKEDIMKDKETYMTWILELNQFRWNLKKCSYKNSWDVFKATRKVNWLIKTILLFLFGNNVYRIFGHND